MTADPSNPNPNTDDKMGWKPGDVRWTKSPPTARKLADPQKPVPKK